MAIDKSDPYAGLPRRSLFGSTAKEVITPKPKVTTPPKPVLTPKAKVAELSERVQQVTKRKGNRMIGVRLEPTLLAKLETWAKANDAGSLPDAIRRLIEEAL